MYYILVYCLCKVHQQSRSSTYVANKSSSTIDIYSPQRSQLSQIGIFAKKARKARSRDELCLSFGEERKRERVNAISFNAPCLSQLNFEFNCRVRERERRKCNCLNSTLARHLYKVPLTRADALSCELCGYAILARTSVYCYIFKDLIRNKSVIFSRLYTTEETFIIAGNKNKRVISLALISGRRV